MERKKARLLCIVVETKLDLWATRALSLFIFSVSLFPPQWSCNLLGVIRSIIKAYFHSAISFLFSLSLLRVLLFFFFLQLRSCDGRKVEVHDWKVDVWFCPAVIIRDNDDLVVWRLNFKPAVIPPVRQRGDKFSKALGRPLRHEALSHHEWRCEKYFVNFQDGWRRLIWTGGKVHELKDFGQLWETTIENRALFLRRFAYLVG